MNDKRQFHRWLEFERRHTAMNGKPYEPLTKREREMVVLRCGNELSYKEIAAKLFVSPKTVATTMENVAAKWLPKRLRTRRHRNASDMTRIAAALGIIPISWPTKVVFVPGLRACVFGYVDAFGSGDVPGGVCSKPNDQLLDSRFDPIVTSPRPAAVTL